MYKRLGFTTWFENFVLYKVVMSMQPTGKNTEESTLCRRPVYTALPISGKDNRCPSAMKCFLAGSLATNCDKDYWNDVRRKRKSESAPNRSRTEDHPITSSLSYRRLEGAKTIIKMVFGAEIGSCNEQKTVAEMRFFCRANLAILWFKLAKV